MGALHRLCLLPAQANHRARAGLGGRQTYQPGTANASFHIASSCHPDAPSCTHTIPLVSLPAFCLRQDRVPESALLASSNCNEAFLLSRSAESSSPLGSTLPTQPRESQEPRRSTQQPLAIAGDRPCQWGDATEWPDGKVLPLLPCFHLSGFLSLSPALRLHRDRSPPSPHQSFAPTMEQKKEKKASGDTDGRKEKTVSARVPA